MNKTSATITLVMCVLGLLVGYTAHRQVRKGMSSEESASISTSKMRSSLETPEEGKTGTIQLPRIQSGETLETLIEKGANVTYSEMALWLVDASEPEIAAYWEAHKNEDLNGDSNGDLRRLIFYNWTRLDPRAAIAAVAGTKRALAPWSAWGANDPQAALAAAGPDQMKSVVNGIGQMQPVWLREHFDLIPEEVRGAAVNGLLTWKEDSDPAARLDFLMKHDRGFDTNSFKTLARKDPWAAYDWLEKHDELNPGENRHNSPIDVLLDTMKSNNPDDLERMAAMTTSIALKREIEDAIFENLLTTDPEAALARAKATEAPLVAARRLGEIGSALLATNPEKAFELAKDILAVAVSQSKLTPNLRIDTGTNHTSWAVDQSPAETFLESLLIKDPERTLGMTTAGSDSVSDTFPTLAGKWAERDLVAYTGWVNRQTDLRIRTPAVEQVVSHLASQGHFQEAAEWAVSGPKSEMKGSTFNLAWKWGRSNQQEASAWVESSDFTESEKRNLRDIINRNQ